MSLFTIGIALQSLKNSQTPHKNAPLPGGEKGGDRVRTNTICVLSLVFRFLVCVVLFLLGIVMVVVHGGRIFVCL